MSSTPLSKDKVEAAIDRMPASLRKRVNAIYRRKTDLRLGSRTYAKTHKNGLTEDEGKIAKQCRKHGMSFREIEGSLRLRPNSGMGAYRLVNPYPTGGARKRKAAAPAAAARKPALSSREFMTLAKQYMQKNPKAAKNVFKEIIGVKKTGRKLAAAAV